MSRERVEPGPGQESVWDYPRPPRLEHTTKLIEIRFNGVEIARTMRARRVLETSHPPVYYIPRADIKTEYLTTTAQTTFCEFKGRAGYVGLSVGGKRVDNAGWFYADPAPAFADLKDCIAFYPSKMDACLVDGETVRPQAGDFYGGWITSDIAGPFKGEPGTRGW